MEIKLEFIPVRTDFSHKWKGYFNFVERTSFAWLEAD
jgi:hypothetical protein